MGKVHWRAIRDNHPLRRAIEMRMIQRELNAERLGKALGIHPYKINRYLKKNPPSISDMDVFNIAKYLDIIIKIEIELC